MGLTLSVEMTWDSPATIKRREEQGLRLGEVHRRGGAGKGDLEHLETGGKPRESGGIEAMEGGTEAGSVQSCGGVKPDMPLLGHWVWHREAIDLFSRCHFMG